MAAEKRKIKPINFTSDTFKGMLSDMSKQMNELLRNMEKHGSNDGVMTVKIPVHTEDKELDDGKEHTVPTFKHKIKTTFPITSESEGAMEGDYVLNRGQDGQYKLELLTEQLDMLEEAVE